MPKGEAQDEAAAHKAAPPDEADTRTKAAPLEIGVAPARDFPDFFTSYMIGIEATWASIAKAEKEARAEQTALIEGLLTSCAEPAVEWDRQWRKASLLEQLIAPYLTLERLKAEIERRLVEAERLAIATASTYRASYVALQGDKATVANLLPLYLTIVDDLQWKYTKNRLDRQARFAAVKPLLWYSAIALVLAVAPFVLWQSLGGLAAWLGLDPASAAHGKLTATLQALYLAASFGLLGALFSRLSSLQTNFLTLDYDLLSHQFKPRVVWLRMTFGVFGSVVLYFAIVGGLLGGDIFPKPDKLATITYGAPDTDFAKLVVWSFLGGFSERLIPDFLQRTEAKAGGS